MSSDDGFEGRLLSIAKDRLRSRRGFYERFAHALANDPYVYAQLAFRRIDGTASATILRVVDPIAAERVEINEMIAFIDEWTDKQPAPQRVEPLPALAPAQAETAEQRQARRYQACVAAGLTMPTDDYAHLPRGVGRVAEAEGVKRPTFTADVKAHIRRLRGRT